MEPIFLKVDEVGQRILIKIWRPSLFSRKVIWNVPKTQRKQISFAIKSCRVLTLWSQDETKKRPHYGLDLRMVFYGSCILTINLSIENVSTSLKLNLELVIKIKALKWAMILQCEEIRFFTKFWISGFRIGFVDKCDTFFPPFKGQGFLYLICKTTMCIVIDS